MKVSLPLLACFSMFLYACDGPYRNCPEHYFSPEFKSYATFNDGSWWVYNDTSRNVTDSINLLSQEINYKEDCDYHGEPQEILTQSFYSSFFDPYTYFRECYADNPVCYDHYLLGFFRDDLEIGESNGFLYEAKLDSLLVNGNWYKEIMVFSIGENFRFYWAKGVGLVKKTFPYPDHSDTIYHFEIVRYRLTGDF